MQIYYRKVPALGGTLYQLLTKHRKAVMAMKLTTILLLAGCLQLSARGISQTITLSLKDAPIQKLFREIERQTDYTFFVESDLVSIAKKVTVSVKNLSLSQVLDLCFKEQPLSYSITGKIITVATKQNKGVVDIKTSPEQLPVDIRGRVVNSSGEPIPDATVSVQGSNKRTRTNAKGEFTIPGVEGNAIVVITHVQYETMSLPIKGNGLVSATLQLRVGKLDELQVIAYGTTTRRFSTGNVATIKSSEIEKQPIQNPLLALQGRVAGVEITQLTGMPGGGVQIRIQGPNSLTSTSREPLIVVDGVPFPSQFQKSIFEDNNLQGGSPLNFINPGDIESIDILKDADATAIYGSRAANGAVLITTKKGKVGRTKADFNVQQGWSKVARYVAMMDTRQYLDMRYEALKNDGIALSSLNQSTNYDLTVWDTTRYTDWQKELLGGTAQYTNVSASVSGGVPSVQYLISGTYNRQTNVFSGPFSDQRGALHSTITGSSKNQRFKIQFSGNYMYDNNQLMRNDLTQFAVITAPNAPALFNDDGSLNWAPNAAGTSTFINPLADPLYTRFNQTTKSIINNLNLGYRIFSKLEFRTSIGYTTTLSSMYLPVFVERAKPESRATTLRQTSNSERDMNSWIFEPQLQYSNRIGKGKLETLVGGTILRTRSKILTANGTGYGNDLLMKTLTAATTVTGSSSTSASNFSSLFGRMNYIWDNKYLVNLTGRRDASSKFGDANKLHDFGSIGLGWIFSEERWFTKNVSFLSYGKLRGSYGTTGNDQIADFQHLSIYTIAKPGILYQNGINVLVDRLPNPYLQWEETRKLQAGIELGFIKDRILVNATYVRNRSSNQLVSSTLPSTTGFTRITQNLPALIQNKNWEFTVTVTPVKTKDFIWTINTNLTIPHNELLRFPGIENTSFATATSKVIIGYGLDAIKLYQYGGVDPTTGNYQAYDKDGILTFTPKTADKTVIMSNFTKFYGGFQNSISYKGVELDFLFQFVRQQGTLDMYYYNGYKLPGNFDQFSSSGNQPVTVLNHWQKPGDDAAIQRYSTSSSNISGSLVSSNAFYNYDPSFIRLKNLSISWGLPLKGLTKQMFQDVRIYFQGQNLYTITKYRGMDPETQSSTTLPPLRTLTFGIRVGL